MKTSTIILLTYFGLLLAGILALFIASKNLPSTSADPYATNFATYGRELPNYSVVVLEESTKCRLIFADFCNVQWDVPLESVKKSDSRVLLESINKAVPAFVRNDTLYVTNTPTGKTWNYRIMTKFVKSVYVKKGACVRLYNPAQDELSVFVNNGECFLDTTNNQPKADRMWKKLHLKIQASNDSYVEINSWIRELSSQLNNSRLTVNSTTYIQKSSLWLKNNAKVTLHTAPNTLWFERDSTSSIGVY
jgi:hypothetical protein